MTVFIMKGWVVRGAPPQRPRKGFLGSGFIAMGSLGQKLCPFMILMTKPDPEGGARTDGGHPVTGPILKKSTAIITNLGILTLCKHFTLCSLFMLYYSVWSLKKNVRCKVERVGFYTLE